jgi:hypothetical protein
MLPSGEWECDDCEHYFESLIRITKLCSFMLYVLNRQDTKNAKANSTVKKSVGRN